MIEALIFKYGGFPNFTFKNKQRLCLVCFESDKVNKDNINQYFLFYDNPDCLCSRCRKTIGNKLTVNALIRENNSLRLMG